MRPVSSKPMEDTKHHQGIETDKGQLLMSGHTRKPIPTHGKGRSICFSGGNAPMPTVHRAYLTKSLRLLEGLVYEYGVASLCEHVLEDSLAMRFAHFSYCRSKFLSIHDHFHHTNLVFPCLGIRCVFQ